MRQRLAVRMARSWLGATLALALAIPQAILRRANPMPGHCSAAAPASHPMAPPTGTVHDCASADCTDCSAVPCRGMTHCVTISTAAISAPSGIETGFAGRLRPALLAAPLLSRTTSPPTPPPISLL